MRRPAIILAVSAAAALALAACGAGDEAAGTATTEASASPETESPSPSPSPSEPTAADGTDVEACFDGECEILVTELPLGIPIDPELGFVELDATEFDGEILTLTVTFTDGAGGWSKISLDGGGSFDDLGFEIVAIVDGDPILSIHPVEG